MCELISTIVKESHSSTSCEEFLIDGGFDAIIPVQIELEDQIQIAIPNSYC